MWPFILQGGMPSGDAEWPYLAVISTLGGVVALLFRIIQKLQEERRIEYGEMIKAQRDTAEADRAQAEAAKAQAESTSKLADRLGQ